MFSVSFSVFPVRPFVILELTLGMVGGQEYCLVACALCFLLRSLDPSELPFSWIIMLDFLFLVGRLSLSFSLDAQTKHF